jgi:protein-tyrosine phosphatase
VLGRRLDWDGCLNARDLGGHATEDGGETAWGRVVRSDSVRSLTGAGWAALGAYGVRTVVDLRSHGELAQDPPLAPEVEVVHVSVHPEHGDPVWQELEAAAAAHPERGLELFYRDALRRWGDRFARAVAAVGDAPEGCVVVHCHGGRDRTGVVAALLLRHAGVSVVDAAEDYALSTVNLEPVWRPWVDEAPDEEERQRRLFWVPTPAAAMRGTLGALEREHGSVAAFLRSQGVAEPTVARARARLRA